MPEDPLLPRDALPPPPPSAGLLACVAAIGPVRTRAPERAWAAACAVSLASAALLVALLPPRPDLRQRPLAWLLAFAALWLAGFAASLAAALVPRRGQVLPDGERAVHVA